MRKASFSWSKLADIVELGVHRIRTRPLRAILSALGISIGIATMVAVIGIPASSQQALDDKMESLGTNILKVTSSASSSSAKTLPLPAAAPIMIKEIGPVTQVSAVGEVLQPLLVNDVIPQGAAINTNVYASDSTLLATVNGSLDQGRFPVAGEPALPEVALGSTAAKRMGISSLDARPQMLWLSGRWVALVGILSPTPLAPEIENSALVSFAFAEKELGYQGNPSMIFLRAPAASIPDVRKVLARTTNPAKPSAADIGNPSDALAARNLAQATFSLLFLGLAGIALIVGGIGVANTMIISVLERRKEIGLRRALGATKAGILSQFFTESLVLCALGGVAGVVLGIASIAFYSLAQGWPIVVPPMSVVLGLVSAMVIGIVTGVYPATRAAKLPPTEALAAL